MAGRPPQKEAPPFGQRLAAARKSKGLSQTELAARMQTTRGAIDYYERRAVNPTLDVIQQVAEALAVPVTELLGAEPAPPTRAKPGPVSQLERRFEQIKGLPRKRQQFILQFLDAMIGAEKA
jgi:transcriptional regulator with XRE-family HTH domain